MIYFCLIAGTHNLEVMYGGVHITGSPFQIRSFDLSKFKVHGVADSVVREQSSFTG